VASLQLHLDIIVSLLLFLHRANMTPYKFKHDQALGQKVNINHAPSVFFMLKIIPQLNVQFQSVKKVMYTSPTYTVTSKRNIHGLIIPAGWGSNLPIPSLSLDFVPRNCKYR